MNELHLFRLQHSVEDSMIVPLPATERGCASLNKAVSGFEPLIIIGSLLPQADLVSVAFDFNQRATLPKCRGEVTVEICPDPPYKA
jgi:hypothetical protein